MGSPDQTPAAVARPVSRRALLRGVLGGGAVAALAGCDVLPGGGGDGDSEPHELEAFLRATVALGDRYDTTIAAVPALGAMLTPLRDNHRVHAQTLAQVLGIDMPQVSSGTPPPTDRGQARSALVAAEKSARDEAVAACLAASPRLAGLLGSIAAARASHLEVLT